MKFLWFSVRALLIYFKQCEFNSEGFGSFLEVFQH